MACDGDGNRGFRGDALGLAASPGPAQWSYETSAHKTGPDHWGALPGDGLCACGKEQSPINIDSKAAKKNTEAPDLDFAYLESQCRSKNNGHTILVFCPPENKFQIGRQIYRLKEIVFTRRASTESTAKRILSRSSSSMSMTAERPLRRLPYLVSGGKDQSQTCATDGRNPTQGNELGTGPRSLVSIRRIFSPRRKPTSIIKVRLTTPPCSESIDWFVLKKSISLDPEQIQFFTSIPSFDRSHRPAQPIGSRKVESGGKAPAL